MYICIYTHIYIYVFHCGRCQVGGPEFQAGVVDNELPEATRLDRKTNDSTEASYSCTWETTTLGISCGDDIGSLIQLE